ncbi:MAG TPA: acyl-CoA thioesterase domain-containing protein, partial [Candidatus Lustribacter sp.]|nr:acyl-CoA thioesterase domain-containing protein [Candidatus Lustribacter sp.]
MDQDLPSPAGGTAPIEDLLDVLDLTPLGTSTITVRGAGADDEPAAEAFTAMVFVGRSQPQPHGRVFGGQVLAQSVMAAGRTVEALPSHAVSPRRLHSLHAYFIRPGDDSL